MARTFRRHRQNAPISELNVTNLIDLGFVLLIIFMIATPLIQQEQTIPIQLPTEAKSAQAKPPPDTEFQTVTIDRNGFYYLGTERVSRAQLSSNLAALAAKPKKPVIRIRADGNLSWQQVVWLIEELKKHGLSQTTFDTESS